jgi:pyruvate,water dikinase
MLPLCHGNWVFLALSGAKVASQVLTEGSRVTVDATCGVVYAGEVIQDGSNRPQRVKFRALMSAVISEELMLSQLTPVTATKIYMNLGQPSLISKYHGLCRLTALV